MTHMWDGPAWWWIAAWLGMAVFWALVILAVVAAAGRTRGAGKSDADEAPITTLERRYARGEISDDEFERRRSLLLKPPR